MKLLSKHRLYLPALTIIAVVCLLLLLMGISTYRNLDHQEKTALGFTHRQGLTLIRALEAGAGAGLSMPVREEDPIQALIEETAKSEDIAYIYLIDTRGIVVRHSMPAFEGMQSDWTPGLKDADSVASRIRRDSSGLHVYDLAKRFHPLPFMADTDMPTGIHGDPHPPAFHPQENTVIILGLRLSAFEEARRSDIHHALIMAAIVVALGSGAIFFVFVIQNFYVVDKALKQTEEKVRRSQKFAAIGKLAAGVAHEVRNPLSSIRGFAQYLRHVLKDRPEEREYAEIMVKEVDRVNTVINDLLMFARPVDPLLKSTDLTNLVDHAVRLVETDAKSKKVVIRKEVRKGLHDVSIDADQMTQVLLNLLLNALQAVAEGGTIELRAEPDDSGRRVNIHITDDGPGISKDHRDKIFDPFFTTREKGTGLGLAMVSKIVENHGGDILVQSPPPGKKRGSRLTINLPISPV